MNKKWWTGIAIVLLIVAFLFTGGIAYESGWDTGYDAGRLSPPEEETWNKGEQVWVEFVPKPDSEEPTWDEILANILEEIDSANITIHIEDTEGRKSDIHISWNK